MTTRFETIHLVPFVAADMQALIADVPSYPRFMPWVMAARVYDRRDRGEAGRGFKGELVVGYKAFRGQFATTVEVRPDPLEVRTHLIRGPFRALDCVWQFRPSDSGTLIDVTIDFEFSEPFLASLLRTSMDKAVKGLTDAFTREAEQRYQRVS